jgi:hypothetical protein
MGLSAPARGPGRERDRGRTRVGAAPAPGCTGSGQPGSGARGTRVGEDGGRNLGERRRGGQVGRKIRVGRGPRGRWDCPLAGDRQGRRGRQIRRETLLGEGEMDRRLGGSRGPGGIRVAPGRQRRRVGGEAPEYDPDQDQCRDGDRDPERPRSGPRRGWRRTNRSVAGGHGPPASGPHGVRLDDPGGQLAYLPGEAASIECSSRASARSDGRWLVSFPGDCRDPVELCSF